MAAISDAEQVVIHGYWRDELGGGVQGTITLDPVLAPGQTGATPNLKDLTGFAHIRTRQKVAVPDSVTGYYAALALASDDPDVSAYGGRRVTFTGYDPYVVAVPYNAPLVTVDAKMATAIPTLTVGQMVRALWLIDAPDGTTPPQPVASYYTSTQVNSLLASCGDLPEAAATARTTANATPANLLGVTTRFDTTAAAITQPLPAAVSGAILAYGWDAGTNALTLTAAGADVIGAAATTSSVVLLPGEYGVLHCTTTGRWRHTAGNKPQAALDQRHGRSGRTGTVVYDEFSRYANTADITGLVPLVGNAWTATGPQGVGVTSGKATSTGVGYAVQTFPTVPTVLQCEITFTGTDPSQGSMTMAVCGSSGSTMVDNLVHFNFGPESFLFTLRKDGGSFDILMTSLWAVPCKRDGATRYRFTLIVRGATVIIIGPNGEVFSRTDPRVGQIAGPVAFWEPITNAGCSVQMVSAAAEVQAATGQLGPADLALDRGGASAPDSYGRIVGSGGGYGQVAAGTTPNYSNMPGMTFGGGVIYTQLAADAAMGVTTLSTADRVPNACSIQIESGSNTETVTASATPPSGGGPFGRILTATTTKAHTAGQAVIATPTRSSTEYFNVENGFHYLPDAPVLVAPAGAIYFGTALDLFVYRVAAGVGGPGPGTSWIVQDGSWNGGHLRLGAYHLWVDAVGALRIKNGAPTSATDGVTVGSQV